MAAKSNEDREYSLLCNLETDHTKLEKGELILRLPNWRPLKKVLQFFFEKELEAIIKVHRYRRSDAQNRYMWGVIVPCVRAFLKEQDGIPRSKDAVYNYLNTHVLGRELVMEEVHGYEVPVLQGKAFSKMNTKEFAEAVDKIGQYYAELGCLIPAPNGGNLIDDHLVNDQ